MNNTQGFGPHGRSPVMKQIGPNGEISVGSSPQLMEQIGPNGELSVGNLDDDNRHAPVAVGDRQHLPLLDEVEEEEPMADRFGCAMFSPRCSGSIEDKRFHVLSDSGAEDLVQAEVQVRSPGQEHVPPPTTPDDFLPPTLVTSFMAMEVTSPTSPSSPQSMASNSGPLSPSKVAMPSMADKLAEEPMSPVSGITEEAQDGAQDDDQEPLMVSPPMSPYCSMMSNGQEPPMISPRSSVSSGEPIISPRFAVSGGEPLSLTLMVSAPDVFLSPTSLMSPAALDMNQSEEINQEAISPTSPTLSAVSDITKQSKESNVNSVKSLLSDSSDDDDDDDEEDSIVLMEKRARRAEAKRVAAEKKLAVKKAELAAKKKAKELAAKKAEELAAKKAANAEAKAAEAKKKKKVSFIEENSTPLSPLSANSCDGDSRSRNFELDDDEETITLGTNEEPGSDDMTDGDSEGLLARSKRRYNAGITPKHIKGTPSSRSGATDSQSEVVMMDDESEASIMVLMRYMGCTPVAYGDSTAMPAGARWLDVDTPEGREFVFDSPEDDNSLLSDDDSYSSYASRASQESLQQELKTTWTYREEDVEMGLDDLVPMSPKSMNSVISASSGPTPPMSPRNKKVNKKKSKKAKKGRDCGKEEAKKSPKKSSKKKPTLKVETDCNLRKKGKSKKKQKAEKPSLTDNGGVLPGGGEPEEELSDDERPMGTVFFAEEEAGEDEAGDMEEESPILEKKAKKATIKEPRKKEATAKKAKKTKEAATGTPTSSKSEKKTKVTKVKSDSGKVTGSADKVIEEDDILVKAAAKLASPSSSLEKYKANASSTLAGSTQKLRSKNAVQDEKEAKKAASTCNETAFETYRKERRESTLRSLADTPTSDKMAEVNASSGVSRSRAEQEKIATALLNTKTPSGKKTKSTSSDKMVAVSGGEKVTLDKRIKSAKTTSAASPKPSKKKNRAEEPKKERDQDDTTVDEIRQPPASTKSSSSRQEYPPPPTAPGDIIRSYLASPVAGCNADDKPSVISGLSESIVSPAGRQLSTALSTSPTAIEATVDKNHSWYEKETMPKEKPLAMAAASPMSEAESVSVAAAAMVAAAMAAAEASIAQSKLMSPRNEGKPTGVAKLEQSPSNRSDKENSLSEKSSCANSAALSIVGTSAVAMPQTVSTIPAADLALPAVGSSGDGQPNLPQGSPVREVDALLAKTRKWLVRHSEARSQKGAITADAAALTGLGLSERKVMGNITAKAVINPENSGKNLLSSVSKVHDSSSRPSPSILMDQLLLAKNANITNATASTAATSTASILRSASSHSMQGPKKSILEQLGEIRAKQRDIEKKQQSKFQRV